MHLLFPVFRELLQIIDNGRTFGKLSNSDTKS